ncbi:hypothetical protein Tco_0858110 [Tanacetum coccineum]|uniref:Uncharacterized protein n=1 Tax=Tanacetum coccineum TaxID=301880 RepID=A0ABQ5BB59_9ASTR
MDNPNITIEEYIRLEEEKAHRREFPAIVFNDTLTSEAALSCDPTKIISVNSLKTDSENDNDKVNMPLLSSPKHTVSYFDDLDFFKDFENEFPAIVYNDAQTSKSDLLTEPILNPQHIDEFNLKDETFYTAYSLNEDNVYDTGINTAYPGLEICTLQMEMYISSQSSCNFTTVTIIDETEGRRTTEEIIQNCYDREDGETTPRFEPHERNIDDVGRESTKSGDTGVLES